MNFLAPSQAKIARREICTVHTMVQNVIAKFLIMLEVMMATVFSLALSCNNTMQ